MWTVRLGAYSLEQDHVGKGWHVVHTESFPTAPEAMTALNASFGKPGVTTYEIVSPDGKALSLNDVYRMHYGEEPIYSNKGYRYPRQRNLNSK